MDYKAWMSTDSAAYVHEEGPVYLEGRLVLSQSFAVGSSETSLQGGAYTAEGAALQGEEPLEVYRIWDDLQDTWYDSPLKLYRYEQGDVVVQSTMSCDTETLRWYGAIDTQARIIPVPDLDDKGLRTNAAFDLCWKRVE